MTRKEAFKFYEELEKSGKLDEFRHKHPKDMTQKELDLFYYDDGEVLYNPFSGEMSEIVKGMTEKGRKLTPERAKILGLWPGMKTRSYSELTDEEKRILEDDTV